MPKNERLADIEFNDIPDNTGYCAPSLTWQPNADNSLYDAAPKETTDTLAAAGIFSVFVDLCQRVYCC